MHLQQPFQQSLRDSVSILEPKQGNSAFTRTSRFECKLGSSILIVLIDLTCFQIQCFNLQRPVICFLLSEIHIASLITYLNNTFFMFILLVLMRCLTLVFLVTFVAATITKSPTAGTELTLRSPQELDSKDKRGFFSTIGNAIGSALGIDGKENKIDANGISTTSDSILGDIEGAIDNVADSFQSGSNTSFISALGEAAGEFLEDTNSTFLQSIGQLVSGNSTLGQTLDNIISSGNSSLGDAIGSLFGGNLTDIIENVGNFAGDLLGAPEFGEVITQVLQGNLSILATPALFLGIGVGDGVVTGLNLSTAAEAQDYVENAVAASGDNNTGLNLVVEKLGRGVANIAAPALTSLISEKSNSTTSESETPTAVALPTASSSTKSSGILGTINLAQIAGSAGQGLADGLGTSLQPVLGESVFSIKVTDPNNDTSVPGIAYAFVRGLSSEAASLGMGFLGIDAASAVNTTSATTTTTKRWLPGTASRDEIGDNDFNHLWRRAADLSGATLVNGSKTDQILGDVAQMVVSTLTCQGMGGLITAFTGALPNIKKLTKTTSNETTTSNDTTSSGSDMKLPAVNLAVTNAGNNYTVALDTMTIKVNEVPIKKLVIFIAAHSKCKPQRSRVLVRYQKVRLICIVVLVIIALLVVFPVSLIIESSMWLAGVFGRPLNLDKVNQWLTILQVGVVPIMVLVGLILGVLAGGNSQHFRTAHGMIGLILALSSITSSGLSFVRRRAQRKSKPAMATRSTATKSQPSHTKLLLADRIVTGLTLLLVFFVWVTGLEDLRSISLCIVDQVSMVIVAMAAAILNWFWEAAIVIISVEWWLRRRNDSNSHKTVEVEQPLMAVGGYKAQLSPGYKAQPSPYLSPYPYNVEKISAR